MNLEDRMGQLLDEGKTILKGDLSTVAYFMGLTNGVCSNYQGDKFQTGSSSISFPSLVIELLTWG